MEPQLKRELEGIKNALCYCISLHTGKPVNFEQFYPPVEPIPDIWDIPKSELTEKTVKLLTKACDRSKMTPEENKELNRRIAAVVDANWEGATQ